MYPCWLSAWYSLTQVEEAVRLVRAAAEHEKLRQQHLRRMKTLRAQLESLEGTKR